MTLLKQITKTALLIPYEQFYIQLHYYHKELAPEQNTGKNNPMYKMIFDSCIMLLPAIYSYQYSDILQLPKSQYRTHSSTY
jgi:hypothetical protein